LTDFTSFTLVRLAGGRSRTLAQRSAQAAKEIKALIGLSVDEVEAGCKEVDATGKTMQEIVKSIQQVSVIVDEIRISTAEQRTGIEQVGRAIASMDQTTQQNAALVDESSSAASTLRESAAGLVRTVGVFKVHSAALICESPLPVPA
jgi:methyl-accepting chemotaxis protein